MTDRIMLVEDELIVAMDVRQRLQSLGYKVAGHAVSGQEAIRMASETKPDLILMDIKIRGDFDGIETAARIRAAQDIPVIYVTAFSDEATLKRARLIGTYGYLIKPFEDHDLRSTIEIALHQHKMERKLRESEERYALAARASNDGIWDWNLVSGEIYYAPRWKSLLGLEESAEILLPGDWFERVHPEDIERLNAAIACHLEGGTPTLECEYRVRHQDGSFRWMHCRGIALFDAQGKPYRMAGSQADITHRKEIEGQLTHRTLHDELTGLSNRTLFFQRLAVVYERIRRDGAGMAAVFFIDIDQFKAINDALGHLHGDGLLTAFSQRLTGCMRATDTIARFGGDEFAALVENVEREEDALQTAERIRAALIQPFHVLDTEISASASIGIAFLTARSRSIDELMRDVDRAMYHAKRSGRARFEVFHPSMHDPQ